MSTVYGERDLCRMCGKHGLFHSFDTRTLETFEHCSCCGYHFSDELRRTEEFEPVEIVVSTIDLSLGKVFFGYANDSMWDKEANCYSKYERYQALTPQTTVDDIADFLNHHQKPGCVANLFMEEMDGGHAEPLFNADRYFEIRDFWLVVHERQRNFEENPGYGSVEYRNRTDETRSRYIPIPRKMTMKEALKEYFGATGSDEDLVIVLHDPVTNKFEFYGITEDAWFSDFTDPFVEEQTPVQA